LKIHLELLACVVFQNIWSYLVFVTMSIRSWLLFFLIACWIAISEEILLKSIIFFSWIKFLEYHFSQLKSSNQVQRCMNWKGIVISSILSQGDIILCGLCQYPSYFYQLFKFSLNSSCFSFQSKPDYPVLITGYAWPLYWISVSFFELVW
jgi:hypothetical protein